MKRHNKIIEPTPKSGRLITTLELSKMKKAYLNLLLILLFIGACEQNNISLENAANSGNIQDVKALIEKSNNEQKRIALLHASRNSHIEIIELLLKYHAPVSGLTLWHAVMGENSDIVKRILEENIDINEEIDQDGSTPLFEAVNLRNKKIVKMLVEHGADTSKKLENGKTVIDIARENNYKEIIEILTRQMQPIAERAG